MLSKWFVLLAFACATSSLSHAQVAAPPENPAAEQQSVQPQGDTGSAAAPAETPTTPTADATATEEKSRGAASEGSRPSSKWDLETHKRSIALMLIGLVAYLAGTGVLLYFSGRTPDAPYISRLKASFFFWLGLGYTVVLLVLAVMYNLAWRDGVPYLFGGVLPIAVPWFGALGAVTISLAGVFHYGQRKWSTDFNYWHLGRPIFGAVLGIVAFFMFVLIISSAGTTPDFLARPCGAGADPARCQPKDFIIYYVLAFLVGYREETFRDLIRRVTDLILKPETQASQAPEITFRGGDGKVIEKFDFPNTAAGTTARVTLEVSNTGSSALTEPTVSITAADGTAAIGFALATDPFAGVKELAAGRSVSLEVTFTPPAAGPHAGALSVAGKNLAARTLPLTGVGT